MSSNQVKTHIIVRVKNLKPTKKKNQTLNERVEFWFNKDSEMMQRMINIGKAQIL